MAAPPWKLGKVKVWGSSFVNVTYRSFCPVSMGNVLQYIVLLCMLQILHLYYIHLSIILDKLVKKILDILQINVVKRFRIFENVA
jgi:hypothetical protein